MKSPHHTPESIFELADQQTVSNNSGEPTLRRWRRLIGRRMFGRLILPCMLFLGGIVLFVGFGISTFLTASWPDDFMPPSILVALWVSLVGFALAVVFVAAIIVRQFIRPLQELSIAARRIAQGDYGYRVPLGAWNEGNSLATTFNAMSEQLAIQFTQLKEDREQLRTILSGMVEGVVAIDSEQRLLFANDRAAELLEFQTPAAVGRKIWEVIRQRPLQTALQRALAGKEPHRSELEWQGNANKTLALYVAPLVGEIPRGAILVVQDTTELRRLERIRQEFVANVSHELKTPLTVIKANVETLLSGAIDDVTHRMSFLDQIDSQADRLHTLIIDLLELARIESGSLQLELDTLELEPIILDVVERLRSRAEGKNQQLLVEPPDSELSVWGDEEALGHILENLIDNALKYTPPGGTIRIRWYAAGPHVCMAVIDNGIGIPERDLPRIFERFYRVDKARSRELGGTGLGLSIVKHLVQALSGSIRAESQLGAGSTFTVCLPKHAPPASGVSIAARPALPSRM